MFGFECEGYAISCSKIISMASHVRGKTKKSSIKKIFPEGFPPKPHEYYDIRAVQDAS